MSLWQTNVDKNANKIKSNDSSQLNKMLQPVVSERHQGLSKFIYSELKSQHN